MRDSGKRSSKVNTKHTENARHFAWKIREIPAKLTFREHNQFNQWDFDAQTVDRSKENE